MPSIFSIFMSVISKLFDVSASQTTVDMEKMRQEIKPLPKMSPIINL
jgi:hypothetical protein